MTICMQDLTTRELFMLLPELKPTESAVSSYAVLPAVEGWFLIGVDMEGLKLLTASECWWEGGWYTPPLAKEKVLTMNNVGFNSSPRSDTPTSATHSSHSGQETNDSAVSSTFTQRQRTLLRLLGVG